MSLGFTGAGIGIAVIDSGITPGTTTSTNNTSKLFPYGNQRVAKFVDFVNGRTLPYDDNGHGTHVAGIIAGNGYDFEGREVAGIAPGATHRVAESARRATAWARSADIIAALNWVAANATTYNISVVNMSVGAGVYESLLDRPADARGQEAHRSRHHRRRRRRQPGQERKRPAAVRRHHRAGQRAVGAHCRRVEHDGHADPRGDDQMAPSARRGRRHRLRRQAGPRRAGHRHGLAGGAGQHASTSTKSPYLLAGQCPCSAPSRI